MARKNVKRYSEESRKNAVRLVDYTQLILTIMSKKLLIVFFVLGSIIPICKAQPLSDELVKNIKSRIEGGTSVGIAIGIVDSTGTHFYNYGIKSWESQEPINEHSVFEIASITKTFTSIILAYMVLNNEATLEDDLQDYLPPGIHAPMRNGRSIKLVELANHTSSLPHSPGNLNPAVQDKPYADYTEDQLYDFINSFTPQRDFGSEYKYSNYAVALLSHILAAKRGGTYEDLVVDVIAKPLGMNYTRIEITQEMKDNLASGHYQGFEKGYFDYGELVGSGGIYSTIKDMTRYLAANMGIMESSLYPAMKLSHTSTNEVNSKLSIGLVWAIRHLDDLDIVYHNGSTPGFRSFIGFIKGGDKGVVVLSNSGEEINDIGFHILNPNIPLRSDPKHISFIMRKIIDREGIQSGIEAYRQIKKEQKEDFDFGEYELNNLGYHYLRQGEIEKAIEVFKLNIEAYPESPNVYDSMAEALIKKGDKEKAIANLKKSIELAPGNKEGLDKLKELGVDTEDLIEKVILEDEILETYLGKYEIVENYFILITKDDGHLIAQIPGQEAYPIFARSETVFYYEDSMITVTFNKNESGLIESLTINQSGRQTVCKKIK